MTLTGGCLCKAVRYTISAPPLAVRTCWCRLCQYLGAGSATVNAGFPAEAVSWTGAVHTYSCTADSGTLLHRSFCPTCGTPMFSQAETRRHQMFVRVGTLDDPDAVRPEITIWTSAAPRWACIDASVPTLAEQPPPAR